MRCLEKRRQKIEKQIFDKESELRELKVHLESMDINVPSLPTIGNSGRITCSKCHHKGHRNQVNNPATYRSAHRTRIVASRKSTRSISQKLTS